MQMDSNSNSNSNSESKSGVSNMRPLSVDAADKNEAREKPKNGGKNRRSCCLREASAFVNHGISQFFYEEGKFVARNAGVVILVASFMTLLGALAFFSLYWEEFDADRLYTPADAISHFDRKYVDKFYGHPPMQNRIIVSSKEEAGRNLLSRAHAKQNLLDFMSLWEEIEYQTVMYQGQPVQLADICFRPINNLPCRMYSVLDAWDYNRTLLEMDQDVLKTISGDIKDPYGLTVRKDLVLWGLTENNGKIEGAEVFLLALDITHNLERIDGASQDPRVRRWDNELVDRVVNKWHNNRLVGYVSNNRAVDLESSKAVNRDVTFLGLAILMVIIYSHVVLFRNSPVYCKAQLALVSVIAVVMSMLTAFGMVLLMGVPMNSVVKTLAFLLLGLGIDDTFVIVGAYFQTSIHLPVEERIGQTMAKAGSSILVTSITDFVAFSVGTYTRLPSIQVFCLYAAVGILFDFIYQITFFVAFVAYDSQREENARNGVGRFGFGVSRPKLTTTSSGEPMIGASIDDPSDMGGSNKSEKELPHCAGKKSHKTSTKKMKNNPERKLIGDGEYDKDAPSIPARLVGEFLPKMTLSKMGVFLVLIIEGVLLGFSVHGCSKVYMDFQYRTWFTPKHSWLHNAFEIEDKYFYGEQTPFSIFTKEPADGGSYFDHQNELVELSKAIRNNPHVAPLPELRNWYEEFSVWLGQSYHRDSLINGRAPNATAFNEWVLEFLMTPNGLAYLPSVRFNSKGSHIVSSRIDGFTKSIKNGGVAVKSVDSLRATAAKSAPGFQPIAYQYLFLFIDGFRVMQRETIRNVCLAIGAVFGVMVIILANVWAALWVMVMIALTDVMLLGFMWYAGLTFNPVTSINVVLAIGIAVDYSAHLAHSFLVATGTKKQRAQKALQKIGVEVFNGGFTTFLAVLVLALTQHYVFRVFFKMLFAIVAAGMWHGLVILPVVLSLVGPGAYIEIEKGGKRGKKMDAEAAGMCTPPLVDSSEKVDRP